MVPWATGRLEVQLFMPYNKRANTVRGSNISDDSCGPCLLSTVCSKAVRLSPLKPQRLHATGQQNQLKVKILNAGS